MEKISRRTFVVAMASLVALLQSLVPWKKKGVQAFEYTLPVNMPYSKSREEMNQLVLRAEKPQIVKVCENVYSAVGFALATMIMVVTPDGMVIIDTTESMSACKQIMEEFRKISDKPVRTIIYTHFHPDHWYGTKSFFVPGINIIAHNDFMKEAKLWGSMGQSALIRAAAMYGLFLTEDSTRVPWVTADPSIVAAQLKWEMPNPEDLVWPTHTFKDQYSFQLGGRTFNLYHTPGETADQVIVEIPEYQVVCPADNYYACFPNLYTIRGTTARPILEWAACQDKMVKMEPDFLVPGHGFPLTGKGRIKETLENYRDAILHVHRLALEAIQQFKPIDEVISQASLPPHLADLPYLRQYYGYIPFCVRSIYQSYVGWFDGDPVNLSPLSRKELGADVLKLAGSVERVLEHAGMAQKEGRYQAALELCEMILKNDPENRTARLTKIVSLVALGKATENSPAANYYATYAAIEKSKL
ncbi:MAG: alkyl sulfatase dimerization domain-containing protein [Thermodesulfobacteriota bacterium]